MLRLRSKAVLTSPTCENAAFGIKFSLENEGSCTIAPADAPNRLAGRNGPMSVFRGSKQRREAGSGIKVREAKPVGRTLL